jgi:hypothetical protein
MKYLAILASAILFVGCTSTRTVSTDPVLVAQRSPVPITSSPDVISFRDPPPSSSVPLWSAPPPPPPPYSLDNDTQPVRRRTETRPYNGPAARNRSPVPCPPAIEIPKLFKGNPPCEGT